MNRIHADKLDGNVVFICVHLSSSAVRILNLTGLGGTPPQRSGARRTSHFHFRAFPRVLMRGSVECATTYDAAFGSFPFPAHWLAGEGVQSPCWDANKPRLKLRSGDTPVRRDHGLPMDRDLAQVSGASLASAIRRSPLLEEDGKRRDEFARGQPVTASPFL